MASQYVFTQQGVVPLERPEVTPEEKRLLQRETMRKRQEFEDAQKAARARFIIGAAVLSIAMILIVLAVLYSLDNWTL